MRPSENCALVWRAPVPARYRLLVRPGREVRVERLADTGSGARRLLSGAAADQTRVSPSEEPLVRRTPL